MDAVENEVRDVTWDMARDAASGITWQCHMGMAKGRGEGYHMATPHGHMPCGHPIEKSTW